MLSFFDIILFARYVLLGCLCRGRRPVVFIFRIRCRRRRQGQAEQMISVKSASRSDRSEWKGDQMQFLSGFKSRRTLGGCRECQSVFDARTISFRSCTWNVMMLLWLSLQKCGWWWHSLQSPRRKVMYWRVCVWWYDTNQIFTCVPNASVIHKLAEVLFFPFSPQALFKLHQTFKRGIR